MESAFHRKGERFWHSALPALAAAMGLAASGYAGSPTLSVAATGTLAAMPPFWTLPTAFLSGLGAAVGIALVNSIGNLAGFFGPYLVGWIKTGTGDFSSALAALAIGPILCAVIVLRLRGPSPASSPSPRSLGRTARGGRDADAASRPPRGVQSPKELVRIFRRFDHRNAGCVEEFMDNEQEPGRQAETPAQPADLVTMMERPRNRRTVFACIILFRLSD